MTQPTEEDNALLIDFFHKRNLFDDYLKKHNPAIFTCAGCGYPTLSGRGDYEICPVCNWEDDGSDDNRKSPVEICLREEAISGPNGGLTLTQNRLNIGRILKHHEKSLNGSINLDTAGVIAIIGFYEQKKEAIGSKMTGDELPQHPLWEAWRNVEKELQIALICISNSD